MIEIVKFDWFYTVIIFGLLLNLYIAQKEEKSSNIYMLTNIWK